MNLLKIRNNSSEETYTTSNTTSYKKDENMSKSEFIFNELPVSIDDYDNLSKRKTLSAIEEVDRNRYAEKNKIEINNLKRQVLHMLKNENIEVGYTSMTEFFLANLLKQNVYQLKEILSLLQVENFDKPEIMQKLIEVMSNLDYKLLYPTNTIIALSFINHNDIGVQEAAIASFEKWDDKRNVNLLNNINYTANWIENYAKDVIQYLEGC